MIEILSFVLGIGFSVLVHFRSISGSPYSLQRKALYSVLSFVGITGMVWLSGIVIAHFLKKAALLP